MLFGLVLSFSASFIVPVNRKVRSCGPALPRISIRLYRGSQRCREAISTRAVQSRLSRPSPVNRPSPLSAAPGQGPSISWPASFRGRLLSAPRKACPSCTASSWIPRMGPPSTRFSPRYFYRLTDLSARMESNSTATAPPRSFEELYSFWRERVSRQRFPASSASEPSFTARPTSSRRRPYRNSYGPIAKGRGSRRFAASKAASRELSLRFARRSSTFSPRSRRGSIMRRTTIPQQGASILIPYGGFATESLFSPRAM